MISFGVGTQFLHRCCIEVAGLIKLGILLGRRIRSAGLAELDRLECGLRRRRIIGVGEQRRLKDRRGSVRIRLGRLLGFGLWIEDRR